MKIKFSITLLAFSMLFLFSCGQGEVGNKDIVVTKKGEPYKLKWATKTHPDGTIMRMHELKELSDGRTVQSKPEGWEWEGSLSQTFAFAPSEEVDKSFTYLGHDNGLDVYFNELSEKVNYVGKTEKKTNP